MHIYIYVSIRIHVCMVTGREALRCHHMFRGRLQTAGCPLGKKGMLLLNLDQLAERIPMLRVPEKMRC